MAVRVVCAGTFDHLHPGHINFLSEAKTKGSELIVIIARDENVRRIKGIMPDHDEQTRKRNVELSGIPDRVVLGNQQGDLFHILHELSPDIVALGYDQRVHEGEIKERLPGCTVIRLQPFHQDKYKSSFYRKSK
mgnify:CR=1 FL=1